MPDDRGGARVEITDLSVRYGSTEAVAGLDLSLAPDTFTVLLGPSGCGKSTTLAVLAGLQRPTSGDVRFDDTSVLDVAPERRPVSMVLQKPLLFPHLSVAQNVGFGLRMARLPRREIAARTEEMLARVRLEGYGDRRPDQLSGGQEQRVALARALVRRPRVLLLDEPFSQLDADLRSQMRSLVRTLHDELDVTSLLVTHDREEAVELGDRIVLMLEGRAVGAGTPEAIYTRPPTLAVADFFGFTGRVPGTVTAGRFRARDGTVRLDGVAGQSSGEGVLVLRPESVLVGTGELEALVDGVRFAGTHVVVSLKVPGVPELCAHVPVAAAPRVGDHVRVTLPVQACTVVSPAATP